MTEQKATALTATAAAAGQFKAANGAKGSKMHRRSRSGCFTCRLRRKKCSEEKPRCRACKNLGLDCEYKRPTWWTNNDTRRKQKDLIKSIIKRTKTIEKTYAADGRPAPNRTHSMPTYLDSYGRIRRSPSDDEEDDDFSDDGVAELTFPGAPGIYEGQQQPYYPPYGHPDMFANGYTYEIDVKTERQMFVNDVPTRHDSSVSTFSTFIPPPPHAVLPSYTGDEYMQQHMHNDFSFLQPEWNMPATHESPLDNNLFDFSNNTTMLQYPSQYAHPQQSQNTPARTNTLDVSIDDEDQPLLTHLLDYVFPLLFPILETNSHGSVKTDVLFPALQKNPAYLHCCLSHAALPPKAMVPDGTDTTQIENDVLRHKFAFVQTVVNALQADANSIEVLEATLGMISLQCVTGSQKEDNEKDIPWHQHFQAATELVRRLELPEMLTRLPPIGCRPPFNMTLTAWIDILGATMLGKAPVFADTYRNRHLIAGSTGRAELMGCADNVMYLLSEVACLDALKQENRLDDLGVCTHVQSLGCQLDATETPGEVLQHPYTSSGALQPRKLSRNITAIFRKALRLYLCNLVPGFDRYGAASVKLVGQIADLLAYIPSGPEGFDRSLIWPLLLAGSSSTPGSTFRTVLASRTEALGHAGTQGNFGRMIRVLQEVWRRNDGVLVTEGICEATPVTAGALSPANLTNADSPFQHESHSVVASSVHRKADVHWRQIMKEQGWEFILI